MNLQQVLQFIQNAIENDDVAIHRIRTSLPVLPPQITLRAVEEFVQNADEAVQNRVRQFLPVNLQEIILAIRGMVNVRDLGCIAIALMRPKIRFDDDLSKCFAIDEIARDEFIFIARGGINSLAYYMEQRTLPSSIEIRDD